MVMIKKNGGQNGRLKIPWWMTPTKEYVELNFCTARTQFKLIRGLNFTTRTDKF